MLCTTLTCVDLWIEAHEGLAAWIQGVGTVGAIIFSVAVAQDAARRQRQEAEARRSEFVSIVETLGVTAGRDLFSEAWQNWWQADEGQTAWLTGSKLPFDRLMETPLVSWPRPRLFQLTAEFIRSVNALIETSELVQRSSDAGFRKWSKPKTVAGRTRAEAIRTALLPRLAIMASQRVAAIALDDLLHECQLLRKSHRGSVPVRRVYDASMDAEWSAIMQELEEPTPSPKGESVDEPPRPRRARQARPARQPKAG